MAKNLIEQAERYREQVRRQNEASKKNWDTVSCRLPKGVKNRVRECGESVNGLINSLVLQWLEDHERKEEPAKDPEQNRYFTIPPVAGEMKPEEEAAALEALQNQVNQKIATQKAELTAEEERKRDRTLLTCVPDEVYEKAKEKINNCN